MLRRPSSNKAISVKVPPTSMPMILLDMLGVDVSRLGGPADADYWSNRAIRSRLLIRPLLSRPTTLIVPTS